MSKCEKIRKLRQKVETVINNKHELNYNEKIYQLRIIRKELVGIMLNPDTCSSCMKLTNELANEIKSFSLN